LTAVFFFVAMVIAASTCCPIRAMAAPSTGAAGACEAKVSEIADAAITADNVIFICFLLDDMRPRTPDTPEMAPAAQRIDIVERLAGGPRLIKIGTTDRSGARTIFGICIASRTRNFQLNK
jgi:hypothetical protein